jgi:hypothetical protein
MMPTAARTVLIWSAFGSGPAGGEGSEAVGIEVTCPEPTAGDARETGDIDVGLGDGEE